ncbi:hypothetical protein QBC34DRAFT_337030 [Podospora aff. communis PSN243]|uniref:Ankyrin repeat protein n=1 Tax=Podospora aff. communis PSN243 TaxID=3040156 RepID=A0AAV9G8H7_9PEZI|nr:hypothetical protein QBC34DRAFT_337030 [Podospora aff. communis PSN243]
MLEESEASANTILYLLSRTEEVQLQAVDPAHMFQAVCRAARCGQTDVLLHLVHLGVDIHLETSDRNTPLSNATSDGDITAMKTLLAAGAPPNDGSLQIAARRLDIDGVSLLQQHGHDTQWPSDRFGGRPALAELCRSARGSGASWEKRVENTMEKLKPLLDHNWKFDNKTILHLILENPESAVPILRAFLKVSKLIYSPSRDDNYLYVDARGLHYSPTMYVKHRCPGKSDAEKSQLIDLLKSAQFRDRYYNPGGKQPEGYTGLPEALQQAVDEERQARLKQEQEIRRAEEMANAQRSINERSNQATLQMINSQASARLENDKRHTDWQNRQAALQQQREVVHTVNMGIADTRVMIAKGMFQVEQNDILAERAYDAQVKSTQFNLDAQRAQHKQELQYMENVAALGSGSRVKYIG